MHAHALKHLRKSDPMLRQLIRDVGPCRIEIETDRSPFHALVTAVAHQQLTGRVAEVILGRFLGLFPGKRFPTPARVLDLPIDDLRSVGFSQAKAASIHDIARQTLAGVVPTRSRIQSSTGLSGLVRKSSTPASIAACWLSWVADRFVSRMKYT